MDNCALQLLRPSIMMAVIVESVPELTALDLSDNKLYTHDSLIVLAVKVSDLKSPSQWEKPGSYCYIIFQFVTCVFLLCI
jgi:hypothetical protein